MSDRREGSVVVDLRTNEPQKVESEAGTDFTALFREGVTLLGPRTSRVVDLSVRQGLPDSQVAAMVGIREEIAQQAIPRTMERVEQALSTFVLVKTRVGVCPDLRRVVASHAGGSLEAGLAAVVSAHLKGCAACAYAWSRIPSPLDVLRRIPMVRPARAPRDSIRERIRGWKSRQTSGWRIEKVHVITAALVVVLALAVGAMVASGNAEAARGAEVAGEAEAARRAGGAGAGGAVDDQRPTSPNPEPTVWAESPAAFALGQPGTTTPTSPTLPAAAEPAVAPPETTAVIPSEPPLVMIITPNEGQRFARSSVIDLVAVVEDDIDEGLAVDWHVGSTHLGSGNAITVTSSSGCPDAVTYNISATVTDSSGNTTRETVAFTVYCDID